MAGGGGACRRSVAAVGGINPSHHFQQYNKRQCCQAQQYDLIGLSTNRAMNSESGSRPLYCIYCILPCSGSLDKKLLPSSPFFGFQKVFGLQLDALNLNQVE